MNYSLEATYYRTALLLGIVRGETVHAWAEAAIEADPTAPHAVIDVLSTPAADLTGLRHALWPLIIEPDPPEVVEAVLGSLHAELQADRRSLADTLTILRQMRSMLRLPRDLYDNLNAALVAHIPDRVDRAAIERWLSQFAGAALDTRRSQ